MTADNGAGKGAPAPGCGLSNTLLVCPGRSSSRGKRALLFLVLLWFAALVLLPLCAIVYSTFQYGAGSLLEGLTTASARHAFWLTLVITVVSVVIATVFGLVLALVLARQEFLGKHFLEAVVDLPFSISPVVAGFMFIILFGPTGWFGHWFERGGIKIVFAVPGMVLATIFVTLPFVTREVLPLLREFGVEQDEAARVLGASKWQTFWRVTLPSIRWGLAYGITLTIARALGEFGAVMVVSGSIIGQTQTVTLHIHQEFTDFHYSGAFAASLALAGISFLMLVAMELLKKVYGMSRHTMG